MEVQTTALDIIADLKHPLNTSEQNTEVHVSQHNMFNQRPTDTKIAQEKRNGKEIGKLERKKIMYVGDPHETVTGNDCRVFFGLRTTSYLKDNCPIGTRVVVRVGQKELKLSFKYQLNFETTSKLTNISCT